MLILIGLGNPGKKYAHTRHNAGRMLAAYLRRHPVEGLEVQETDCYMNESGEWLRKKLKSYGLWVMGYGSSRGGEGESATSPSSSPDSQLTTHNSQLFIAHDDLDLPLGSFKIQFATGPRLHKGILSIEQALGTKDFWRVRIGVEGRGTKAEGRRPSGEEYVLRPFKREEKVILIKTFGLIKRALICHPERSVAESRDLASFSERSRSLRWVSRLPPVARDDDNPV